MVSKANYGNRAALVAFGVMVGLAGSARAAMLPPNVKTETIGGATVLATSAGKALYIFDKDQAGSGKSACQGVCANYWPPLMAPAGFTASGSWSVINRGGAKQLAYHGKPLYSFAADQPGTDSGNGFKGLWHVATPGLKPVAAKKSAGW